MRAGRTARVILLTGVTLIGAALAGCGGGGASSSADSSASLANPNGGQGASQAVTLSWDAPTENSDGTPLTNLQGYKVHYGAQPGAYSDTIEVANPGLTMYVVQNLAAGTYYFAISSYNSSGEESALSPEVSAMVD